MDLLILSKIIVEHIRKLDLEFRDAIRSAQKEEVKRLLLKIHSEKEYEIFLKYSNCDYHRRNIGYEVAYAGGRYIVKPHMRPLEYSKKNGHICFRASVYDKQTLSLIWRGRSIPISLVRKKVKLPTKSAVYILYSKKMKLYKIGYSSSVDLRIKRLRAVYEEDLTLIMKFDACRQKEGMLHSLFKHRKKKHPCGVKNRKEGDSEWFKLGKADIEVLKNFVNYLSDKHIFLEEVVP